jgi:hypothetical protein
VRKKNGGLPTVRSLTVSCTSSLPKAENKDDIRQTNDSQFVALDDKINKNRGAPSNARMKRTRLRTGYFIGLLVINLATCKVFVLYLNIIGAL